jgi:hypothetical protein
MIHVAPASITLDGSRDVTAELNDWLNTLPDGDPENWTKARMQEAARYRIDGSVSPQRKVCLSLDGNRAMFDGRKNADGQSRHWQPLLCRGLKLANFVVKGANPKAGARADAFVVEMQWQHGIGIRACTDVLIDQVQVYDVYGDFVAIQPEHVNRVPTPPGDVTVRRCHFERNGRMGVAITGGTKFRIEQSYIGEVRHALLDLEPEWAMFPITDVVFTRNVTGETWLPWVGNGGLCNAGVGNVRITYNVMRSRTTAGVPLVHVKTPPGCAQRGPFWVERNTLFSRSSPMAPFTFEGAHDVYIRRNTLVFGADARPRVFADLQRVTKARVERNTIEHQPGQTPTVMKVDVSSLDCKETGNSVRLAL